MADSVNTQEIWKDIAGYEGHYQVSSTGRVRSLDRLVNDSNGKKAFKRFSKGRVLKPHISKAGYNQVALCKDGLMRSVVVCRMAAMTFLGPPPMPHYHCAHNDGNSLNDNIENLRWATPKENVQDQRRHGTLARGERHGHSKLTRDDIKIIRETPATLGSGTMLAQKFSVACSTISKIRNGTRWE